jgi:P4 family phage/plasmid primase-like protien
MVMSPTSTPERIDFSGIHARALYRLKDLLLSWYPDGEIRGCEFVIGSWAGEKGDSLSINLTKGFGVDFASDEKAGDIVAIAAKRFGVGMAEAARIVQEMIGDAPVGAGHALPAPDSPSGAKRAAKIIGESIPLKGTPAEKYLKSRGITVGRDYAEIFKFRSFKNGCGSLVCICEGGGAVQQVYLTKSGEKDTSKSPIKRTNGSPAGHPIIIPPAPGSVSVPILLCEGPEDGLSLAQALGYEVWATLGIVNIEKIPFIPGREYILVRDNDAPLSPADEKVKRAVSRLLERGFNLRIARPPEGIKDANELLQKSGEEALKKMVAESAAVAVPLPEEAAAASAADDDVYFQEPPPSVAESRFIACSRCQYTDIGNAERVAARWGQAARYSDGIGWLFYKGGVWVSAEGSHRALRMVTLTAKEIVIEANYIDPKYHEALKKWCKKSQDVSRLAAMLKIAAAHLTVNIDALDNTPFLLNVANGVVNLETGELLPHSPKYLQTLSSPIEYRKGAECPAWKRFIKEIFLGDEELIQYVQRAVGYTLTADTREQCFFILHGIGANGKSTFLDIIAAIMGEYHQITNADALMDKGGGGAAASPYLAVLRGKRFVNAAETRSDKALNEAIVKKITGESKIAARALYQQPIVIAPQFKLWLATNHRPDVFSTDEGIWRRIKLIPFRARFYDSYDPDVPTNGPFKDMSLPARLREELSGILSWAVEGCMKWLEAKSLTPADTVHNAIREYREDMDVIGAFIEERCETHPKNSVAFQRLYNAYRDWCKDSGHSAFSKNRFGRRLTERGFERTKDIQGERAYKGLGLKF